MKKTLLATAIAGAMAFSATAAQAATVYDQDGTQLNIGGRVALGISNLDGAASKDSGSEFRNIYSRLNINGSNQITQNTKAFFEVEWRFTGDERDTSSGFQEVRTSLIGLENDQFGTVMAGNFGGLYNTQVLIPFDVYIDRGYNMTGHPYNSRGDSLAYMTPDLSGFQAFIQGKHYSENNTGLDSADVVTQGGVKYENAGLRLALGWAEAADPVVSGNSDDDTRFGGTVSYAFNDMFSARIGHDAQNDIDTDVTSVGGTVSMGQWAFHLDYSQIDPDNGDSRDALAGGAYYTVTNNFNVFVEADDADTDSTDTYVLTGARYMF